MSNNTKLVLTVIGIILCISLIGGGIILMQGNREEWPPDDIYVYNSSGYMAYEPGETIAVNILLCSVHRSGNNPMEQYQNVYFETITGIRYQADLTNDIKRSLFDEKEMINESIVKVELNGNFVSGNTLNFTKLILEKRDGTEIIHDFGNIEVEIIQSSDIHDKIAIEIPTVYSVRLDEFQYTIENKTESEIVVQELYLGDGISYDTKSVSVPPLGKENVSVDFIETEEVAESPNYFIIKPKFTILTKDGQEYVCSSVGSTAYAKNISTTELRKYLISLIDNQKKY